MPQLKTLRSPRARHRGPRHRFCLCSVHVKSLPGVVSIVCGALMPLTLMPVGARRPRGRHGDSPLVVPRAPAQVRPDCRYGQRPALIPVGETCQLSGRTITL
jgi:hypothetical protein